MGYYTDRAKVLRPVIEQASTSLPDSEAFSAPELFPRWDGDSHAYVAGDRVDYMGKLYKCLQNHTSQADWTPDKAVSLWVEIPDPSIEWPEWKQPTGAHDAYAKGDKFIIQAKKLNPRFLIMISIGSLILTRTPTNLVFMGGVKQSK